MGYKSKKNGAYVILLIGVGLWIGFAMILNKQDCLSFNVNVAGVKGSPYGKVLGLVMQGSIDLYFHKGQSHATSAALGDDEHAEDCGCGAHDHHSESAVVSVPLRHRFKKDLSKMEAYANRKTDGQPVSQAHEHYLQSVNEDKLKWAYELDPSNYTNYGNYHLFLYMSALGKSKGSEEAALSLAYRTLEFCKRDDVDPATWLTASSAAYNVITHIGRNYKKYTVSEAKESLFEFDFCMENYEKLLDESVKKGSIVSTERLLEMKARAKFLIKLRQAQGVYMKRIMSNESDGIPSKKE